jgi:hypothetical protein
MHSAIIYVVLSNEPRHDERQRAALLLVEADKLEQKKLAVRLGDYVWQINFREYPGALSQIVVACERLAIPYRILPLDAEPQWIRVDPNAE